MKWYGNAVPAILLDMTLFKIVGTIINKNCLASSHSLCYASVKCSSLFKSRAEKNIIKA